MTGEDEPARRGARSVRKFKLGEEPDDLLEWATRPWDEKWRVIMELRALMPQVTGDPALGVERVVFKRRLGEHGVDRPQGKEGAGHGPGPDREGRDDGPTVGPEAR